MSANARFAIMIAASVVVFLGVLRLTIGGRLRPTHWLTFGWPRKEVPP